jgi:hypothetical protein
VDEELKEAIANYFEVEDLCELLGITIVDFIRAFEAEIEENVDLVTDEMGHYLDGLEEDEDAGSSE